MTTVYHRLLISLILTSLFSCSHTDTKGVKNSNGLSQPYLEIKNTPTQERQIVSRREGSPLIDHKAPASNTNTNSRNIICNDCCLILALCSCVMLIDIPVYYYLLDYDLQNDNPDLLNPSTIPMHPIVFTPIANQPTPREYPVFHGNNSLLYNTTNTTIFKIETTPPSTTIFATIDNHEDSFDFYHFFKQNEELIFGGIILVIILGWILFCLGLWINKRIKEKKTAKMHENYLGRVQFVEV